MTTYIAESQAEFPGAIDQVPSTDRVYETFGWLPLLVGGPSLCMAVILMFSLREEGWDTVGSSIVAGLAVTGAVLLFYDVWRRSNRTILVPRNGLIGIYRKGTFIQTIDAGDMIHYRLDWLNTIYSLVLCAAAMFISFALVLNPSPGKPLPFADHLLVVSLGPLGLTALISVIRTRILSGHFHLPQGRRLPGSIMIRRSEVSRVISGVE